MFRRRSLTLSLLLLSAGFLQVGALPLLIHSSKDDSYGTVIVLVVLSTNLLLVFHGFRNLIKDVERGYSSSRSALSAVFLLLSITPSMIFLLSIFSDRYATR